MPKGKSITWRPSIAAERKLERLAEATGHTVSMVLEALIMAKAPDILADNDRPKPTMTAQGVDPAKILAFQRKAGMDIFDAKARKRKDNG